MQSKGIGSLLTVCVVAVLALGYTFWSGNQPNLGLDLQGGVSVVLQPVEDGEPMDNVSSEELEQAQEIISTRVNAIGVGEPDISVQGSTIVVQIPGADDQQRVLDLVGKTAELRFRPVLEQLGPAPADPEATEKQIEELRTTLKMPDDVTAQEVFNDEQLKLAEAAVPEEGVDPESTTTTTTTPDQYVSVNQYGVDVTDEDFTALLLAEQQNVEVTAPADDQADQEVILLGRPDADGVASRYRLGPMLLLGDTIEDASAGLSQNGQWEVRPVFKDGADGIDQFNQAAVLCNTGAPECPAQQGSPGALGVVLDSEVLTAPAIQESSFSRDQITISGDFDEQEAKDVALALRYGALPLTLEAQTVQTVSATLGSGALDAGLVAGGVGLGLVALYVLLYYRLLGTLTVASLLISGSLLWSIIAFFGAKQGLALTLAGIVGIIVSVGVTIDSSIVYFESIKESVRNGRTLRSTMDPAYKQAFGTIVKADTSSLIAAIVLYVLSVGPVRGFAFYLGLATLLDLIMSYAFMRPAARWLATSKFASRPALFGIPVSDLGKTETSPEAAAERLVSTPGRGGSK